MKVVYNFSNKPLKLASKISCIIPKFEKWYPKYFSTAATTIHA